MPDMVNPHVNVTLFSCLSKMKMTATVIRQTTKAMHQHSSSITLLIQTRILPWSVDVWLVDTNGMKTHWIALMICLKMTARTMRLILSLWDKGHSQVMISHAMKRPAFHQVLQTMPHPQVQIQVCEESMGCLPMPSDSGTLTHFMNNCNNT
jgi:hypothetical protein